MTQPQTTAVEGFTLPTQPARPDLVNEAVRLSIFAATRFVTDAVNSLPAERQLLIGELQYLNVRLLNVAKLLGGQS